MSGKGAGKQGIQRIAHLKHKDFFSVQGPSEINILSHKYLLSVSSTLGTLPGVFISQLNSGQPCLHVPKERPRQVANDLQSPHGWGACGQPPLCSQQTGLGMGYRSCKLKVMKQKGQELRGWGDDSGDKQRLKAKGLGSRPSIHMKALLYRA